MFFVTSIEPARLDRAKRLQPSLRFAEIIFVDLEADKLSYAAALRSDGRVPDPEKRIEHGVHAGSAVQFNAPFRELNGKRRWMGSLFLAALNRFVRNKPGVAAATQVASTRVRPTGNVAFVLVRNADGTPIELYPSGFRKVKQVFVAIVQKPFRTDRLEMAMRAIVNRDRFDPVDGVLKNEQFSQLEHNFVGQHWIRWCRADVEKKRTSWF